MNNNLIGVADELHKIVALGECLKDAQQGLSENNEDVENHFWLSQVINDRLRDVIKTLEGIDDEERETPKPDRQLRGY